MKWHCVFACFVMLIHVVHGGTALDRHYRRSFLNGRKLNALKEELIIVKKLVTQLTNDKESCTNELADVTKQLKELTDKIGELNDVDVDVSSHSTTSSVVKIKVSCGYETCMKDLEGSPITDKNAKIWCLRRAMWDFSMNETENDDDVEIIQAPPNLQDEGFNVEDPPIAAMTGHTVRSIIDGRDIVAPADITMPPTGKRTRREYRTLSYEERQRYHDAVNVLYNNAIIDTFARIHRQAIRTRGAHGGPAFLPWHRAFLAFYEEALREVDPSVSLPYWDSSIDQKMASPSLSVMWDEEHLGSGTGVVTNGPFANWITANSPLRRNVANGGGLIRQSRINNVMSFCLRQDFDRRWENAHNSVHRWVAGTMARSLSASDPVFYMHHAFIDYQWEKFREHQLKDCVNVFPTTDYPPTDDENHQSDANMDGMSFLKNIDGIAEYWTKNWYDYEDTPNCTTGCNNYPDLLCVSGECVGKTRDVLGSNRKKRQTKVERVLGTSAIKKSRVTVDNNNKTSSGGNVCARNPYHRTCPTYRMPIETDEDYLEAMLVDEVPKPPGIDHLGDVVDAEFNLEFKYPPEIGPIVFKAAEDEASDCRSLETGEYDILSAVVRGQKISKEGKFRAGFSNPYKPR